MINSGCVCVHIYILFSYVYMYMCMYIYIYMYVYVYVCVYVCICVFIYIYICVCVCILRICILYIWSMFTHCYANQSFSQQNHPFIATENRSKIRCSQASIWDMVRIPGYHDGSSGDSQPFWPERSSFGRENSQRAVSRWKPGDLGDDGIEEWRPCLAIHTPIYL